VSSNGAAVEKSQIGSMTKWIRKPISEANVIKIILTSTFFVQLGCQNKTAFLKLFKLSHTCFTYFFHSVALYNFIFIFLIKCCFHIRYFL
jgi:hypothetical protein